MQYAWLTTTTLDGNNSKNSRLILGGFPYNLFPNKTKLF